MGSVIPMDCIFTKLPICLSFTMPVTIITLRPGDGKTYPRSGDVVTLHYVGRLADGSNKIFDSSNEPFKVSLGRGLVIKGWEEGLLKLSKGEKALINTPSDLAYGARGYAPIVPPNTPLTFEVELLDVHP